MNEEVINTPAPAPAPAVVEATPAVPNTAAPEAQASVSVPAPEAPKAPETLLGTALENTAPPVAEAPKEPVAGEQSTPPEAPKAEGEQPKPDGQSAEPAPPPVYDAWTLPEGLALDENLSKEFTGILSEFETNTKADHALVQAFGQKAVDFYVSEQKKLADNIQEFYATNWEKQKIQWKDQFLADPELGGNRAQTTVDSALNFIRTHGGSPEQQAEFKNLMETSGLGNHPAMIRILANAARAYQEGEPLAAQRPVPPPKSRISTMYGNKS